VDTGVGNVAVAHSGQLLAEVGRMLVLRAKVTPKSLKAQRNALP